MDMHGQQKELSKPILAAMIIFFSFIAGAATASGIRGVLVARSEYHWLFEFAMALFLVLSAVSYAQRLGRAGNP